MSAVLFLIQVHRFVVVQIPRHVLVNGLGDSPSLTDVAFLSMMIIHTTMMTTTGNQPALSSETTTVTILL